MGVTSYSGLERYSFYPGHYYFFSNTDDPGVINYLADGYISGINTYIYELYIRNTASPGPDPSFTPSTMLNIYIPSSFSFNLKFYAILPNGDTGTYYSITLPSGWNAVSYTDPYLTYGASVLSYNTLMKVYDASGTYRGSLDFRRFSQRDGAGIVTACFTTGAMIWMGDGARRRIDDLQPGDMVMTRDHGPRPLRWAGSRRVTAETLEQFPELRPIRFAKGALGDHAETLVSPQHRVFVASPQAELATGSNEVLVPAKGLVNGCDVTVAQDVSEVTYFHLLFDEHEIIQADGLWSESFHPAPAYAGGTDEGTYYEVVTLFPELESQETAMVAARPTIKPKEVAIILPAGERKLAQPEVLCA